MKVLILLFLFFTGLFLLSLIGQIVTMLVVAIAGVFDRNAKWWISLLPFSAAIILFAIGASLVWWIWSRDIIGMI